MNATIDYTRKWLVLVTVGMGVFLATIDSSVVNVALPTLVRDLDTDFATVQWVVLAYLLTTSTLLLSMGRLGDMVGKKPIYLAGFAVFTVGSLLCGLAPTAAWLIGFRVLQAIGAAMTQALGFAIVTEAFPPAERGKALGISGTLVSVGIVLGPTVGGLLIDALSWRWIFYVNLPIGIVGLLMVVRFVPRIRPLGHQRFDFAGALLLFLALLSLLLALTLGQDWGFLDGHVLVLLGASILFAALFIIIERRVTDPMIDLDLFQNRLFNISLLTGLIAFVAVAGVFILLPFYLENMLGFDTRQVGLLIAAVPILLGVMAPIAGVLSDRVGTRPIATVGLIILLIGYVAMSQFDLETTIPIYILSVLPFGAGMGIFQSPNNSAIMGAVPHEKLGITSSLLAITRNLGQTTGIALLGAIWAARTMSYAGFVPEGGATAVPIAAQIGGLHDTFVIIAAMIGVALLLSLWGLMLERQKRIINN
ncbi:MAG: DHA2 family efflux MFS transporter permease subunit [Chloroflexi bacterium]|nr:DHA2 family efflux MFS transporter permease subunit [Chloroflexota bacterium]